ncbi:MAG TPA: histidine kinase [Solirubrobacteraceae bacterium]|jgi:signal transduction histidine kinase|nr:histidine kinase [Solirubrobacteraceae bacterium]
MADHSDELLLTWLNQRVERLAEFSARHRSLTDGVLAAGTAATSIVGLAIQHRITPAMLAFCAGLCLPLLLRHGWPRLCFACIAVVLLVQWLISGPQLADAALLIALYWICLETDLRSITAAVAVAEAGAIMLALRWETQQFKYWVGITGLAVAAAALGLMIRQRRELLLSMEEKAARLERERDQQAELGAAAERARIAREMHDIVSHNLTVMIALADGARYALEASPAQASDAIERLSATGREALVEMRRLLGALRDDSTEGPLEPQPTLERLDELVARVDAAGIPVTIGLDGNLHDLAPGVQLAVFRVAQEALTNTLKHAARPTAAHLEVRCRGGQVDLEVTNTGNARTHEAIQASDGRGLLGMRERANVYDGELDVGPTEDGGWRVHLRLHNDTPGPARSLEPVG